MPWIWRLGSGPNREFFLRAPTATAQVVIEMQLPEQRGA